MSCPEFNCDWSLSDVSIEVLPTGIECTRCLLLTSHCSQTTASLREAVRGIHDQDHGLSSRRHGVSMPPMLTVVPGAGTDVEGDMDGRGRRILLAVEPGVLEGALATIR